VNQLRFPRPLIFAKASADRAIEGFGKPGVSGLEDNSDHMTRIPNDAPDRQKPARQQIRRQKNAWQSAW
jgi:hypothetical protein